MPELRDILTLTPKPFVFMGYGFKLARPSIVDLLELSEINQRSPAEARLWALRRHLLDSDGQPVFATDEEAKACPAGLSAAVVPQIEALYGEGLD